MSLGTNTATSSCFSLAQTNTCREFSQYFVQSQTGLFTNIQEFDAYIRKSVPTAPAFFKFFNSTYNCPHYDGSTIRYAVTFLCGMVVDISTVRFNCNAQTKQICKSTAQSFLSSYNAVFKNPQLCPPAPRALPADYATFASTRLNETTDCISSVAFESFTCGFAKQQDYSSFCSSSTDPCCSKMSTNIVSPMNSTNSTNSPTLPSESHGLSPVMIGVIVASGAALIALIVLLIYWFKKPKEKGTTFVHDDIEIMDVVFDYQPNLFDEITLKPGDKIAVKHRYSDGWAFGQNLVTKKEGSFPLACVTTEGQESRQSVYSRRQSSLR